jgi:dolichol-phosphate mannosyltransferase
LAPKVRDRTSGYFALRRSVLPPLDTLNGTGFKIMLEVLVKSGTSKVGEVPCSFVPRAKGASKFDAKQVREYLKHLGNLYIFKYKRFLKFCLVGVWGSLVNLGLYALFMYTVGLHYLISAVIGVEVAVITQFILNDRWTFKDRRDLADSTLVRARKYFITCAGGIVIYFIVLSLLVEVFKVHEMVSAFLGILAGFMWNFTGSTLWAWRVKKHVGN